MQNYTQITENHAIDESRELLLFNDMTALTQSAGVGFPNYAMPGTPCYRVDQQRLFIMRSDGTWRMIADTAKTHISLEDANARYSLLTHHHDAAYAPRVSAARPGVDRIYRRDANNGHNVQVSYTGSFWLLQGYNGDTPHDGVLVERSNTCGVADNATKLNGLAASNYLRSNVNQTFSANLTISGSVTVQTNLTVTGDVTSASDIRLKEDVKSLEGALETVNRLRGVTYRHKTTGRNSIGFIANELQKHVPEVVVKGSDKKLSVAYGNITALLAEAVKELTARLEKLETAHGV